jgi:DNA-binding IclR family transcriptional regulator
MDSSGTRYQLGLHLMEISRWAWERSDVRSAASSVLRTLAKETGETVHLASLIDNEIVYLDKVDSEHSIRLYSAIGKRNPIHCTGLGKVLTAFLPLQVQASLLEQLSFHRFTPHTLANGDQMKREWVEIRRTHIAFDREEHAEGVHCVAAPIFDFRGHPVAALSVTAPTFRVSVAQLEQLVPSVLAAARTITDALGGAVPAEGAA